MRLLDPSQAPSTEAVDPSLLRAFVRIDLQGAFFIGIRLPSLSFITSTIDNELPGSFTDLTQARNFVTTWSCRLFFFLRTVADKHKFVSPGFVALEALAEAQKYEQVFVSIERLLFAFMQKPNVKLTFREHHGLAMLRALAIENRIIAAGCLYTQYFLYVDAEIAFGTRMSVEALVASIVGGVGTVLGPVVGALALHGLGELTRLSAGGVTGVDLVLFGLILVAVIAFAPLGIVGSLRRLRGRA